MGTTLWRRPGIAGKSIRLRDRAFTVVGVLPASFSVLQSDVEVWIPLGLNPSNPRTAGQRTLGVIARLNPGVTFEQASSELDTIGSRLEQANPTLDAGWRPSPFPIREELSGNTRQPLLVLSGAVAFLLLMACANVASLLLARGASRRKEIAVRFAMGAARGRIVAQLLSESIVLSLAGGVLGLAVAWLGIALVHRFGPATIPQLRDVTMDARLFLFALAVSLATGILFGILPALHNSAIDLNAALSETSRGGTASRTGRRMRGALVVAEVALAVLVLIGAGLLVRSFVSLRKVNAGFRPEGVVTLRLPLQGGRNGTRERAAPFLRLALESLSALPGVQSAALTSSLPLAGLGLGTNIAVAGRRPRRPISARSSWCATSAAVIFRPWAFLYFPPARFPTPVSANAAGDCRQPGARSPLSGGPKSAGTAPDPRRHDSRRRRNRGRAGDVKQEKIVGEDWPTLYGSYMQWPPAYATMALAPRAISPLLPPLP